MRWRPLAARTAPCDRAMHGSSPIAAAPGSARGHPRPAEPHAMPMRCPASAEGAEVRQLRRESTAARDAADADPAARVSRGRVQSGSGRALRLHAAGACLAQRDCQSAAATRRAAPGRDRHTSITALLRGWRDTADAGGDAHAARRMLRAGAAHCRPACLGESNTAADSAGGWRRVRLPRRAASVCSCRACAGADGRHLCGLHAAAAAAFCRTARLFTPALASARRCCWACTCLCAHGCPPGRTPHPAVACVCGESSALGPETEPTTALRERPAPVEPCRTEGERSLCSANAHAAGKPEAQLQQWPWCAAVMPPALPPHEQSIQERRAGAWERAGSAKRIGVGRRGGHCSSRAEQELLHWRWALGSASAPSGGARSRGHAPWDTLAPRGHSAASSHGCGRNFESAAKDDAATTPTPESGPARSRGQR